MHIQTRRQLEHLLTMLAEEGEEKTFAYVRRILKKAVGQTDIVPDVQPGGQTQSQKGLHTVISDLFETGKTMNGFYLLVLLMCCSCQNRADCANWNERRDAGDNRQQDMRMRDTDCGCRNGDRVQYGCSCENDGWTGQSGCNCQRENAAGMSGEVAKLPDLCRNSRTATAGSRCRGRAACSVTTGS